MGMEGMFKKMFTRVPEAAPEPERAPEEERAEALKAIRSAADVSFRASISILAREALPESAANDNETIELIGAVLEREGKIDHWGV